MKKGNFDITNSKKEKLLGVKFDHKFFLDDHISELCKKANRKCIIKSSIVYEFQKKYSY